MSSKAAKAGKVTDAASADDKVANVHKGLQKKIGSVRSRRLRSHGLLRTVVHNQTVLHSRELILSSSGSFPMY